MAKDRDVRRDRAGQGPDPSESRRRLVSIDAVKGFQIAKGEPDVRGWEVRTLSDRDLGTVGDLLIDPDRGEVVMLEVALHGEDIRTDVPIRSVQLDRGRRVVLVDSADVEHGSRRGVVEAPADSRHEAEPRHEADTRREEEARHQEERTVVAEDHRRREEAEVQDGTEERVVERRPYVEEVVIRRRPVE